MYAYITQYCGYTMFRVSMVILHNVVVNAMLTTDLITEKPFIYNSILEKALGIAVTKKAL